MPIETPVRPSNGLALTSLTVGLLGVVGMVVFFIVLGGMTPLVLGGTFGILALVLGILALKRGQSRAFAVTGIIVGALSLLLGLGLLLFALLFVGALTLGA